MKAGLLVSYPSQRTDRRAENSTVDDWFAQDVERDRATAEEALRESGGDATRAEEIFEGSRTAVIATTPPPTNVLLERTRCLAVERWSVC